MSLVKHRFRLRDGSLTKSKDWYARFTYKGNAHYFSTRTPNKSLAAKIESTKLQELIEKAELGLSRSVAIRVALDKYVQSMAHSGELKNIKNHCNKFMGFKQGLRSALTERSEIKVHGLDPKRAFDSISIADIQYLVMARRSEGCSNATILHELSTLNQAIKLNKKIGNPVPVLSFRDIKKDNQLKPSKGRLRYLSKEEEVRLLAALDPENHPDGFGALTEEEFYAFRRDIYDLAIVLLDTGTRYSEAAGLTWDNVDLKERTIALYRSKVKNESTLQMTARVHNVLTRRFESPPEGQKYIFESKDGKARKYAPGAFVRACKRCGIEGITLHSLRHTFASRVVQAGLSLVEIQNLLGHASPVTSLRYAHLAPNQAASKAVSVLDKFNGESLVGAV
jgi:integrase